MGRARAYFNTSQGQFDRVFRTTLRNIPLFASLALAIAACSLAGCAPVVDQRGKLPDPDRLAQIHPGTTTREQVAQILGTPSSTGVFDDKNWYYISRRTKQVAFFDPDVVDQQVYIVNFDDKGVVRAVDHKELTDGQAIEPAPGATPARRSLRYHVHPCIRLARGLEQPLSRAVHMAGFGTIE